MAGIDDFTAQQWTDLGNYLRAMTPIDQLVQQSYPQLAWAMANPEIGPILQQAAREQWDTGRLQAAIEKTNWWKTTDAAQREWQRLTAEDPQSAYIKYLDAATQVQTLASRLGVTLSPAVLKSIGEGVAVEGWDTQRMTQEIMRNAGGFNPNGTGDINGMVNQIKDRASEFLMPLSDQAAFDWTKNIISGTASKDGLDAYLRQQAINRFAGDKTIVAALQQGATVKQIFDPYVQQTAQLLEISPDQVNLMDTKWAQMIDSTQTDGTRRPMTLSEAGQYVRGLSEWKGTQQAGQASAGFAETILKTFGEVG